MNKWTKANFQADCPCCGIAGGNLGSPNAKSRQPAPGHFSLCCHCGEFLIVASDGKTLNKITPEQYGDLTQKSYFQKVFNESIVIKAKYTMRN